MNEPRPLTKILVVEDERTYSRLAHQMLAGNERIDATTAAEGLRLFHEEAPDIVLLDIGLPDQNGLDTLLAMKAARPDAFIVMFTASRVAADVQEALKRGAAGYITKPLTRGKIVKHIDSYHAYREKLASMPPQEKAKMEQEFRRMAENLIKTDSKPESAPARRTPGILCVEADAENGVRMRENLLAEGYLPEIAHSGTAALKLAGNRDFDAVVISAPVVDMEAAMLVLKLRLEHQHTPICVLLESPWDRDNPKWTILRVSEFLVKPVKMRHLAAALARHLEAEEERKKEKYV